MKTDQQNRILDSSQVFEFITTHMPHLSERISLDRTWVWYAGPKPSDEDRRKLLDVGFRFTPTPHVLPNGSSGHWYHSCGGAVIRRRRHNGDEKSIRKAANGVSTYQQQRESSQSEAMADLSRLADLLP